MARVCKAGHWALNGSGHAATVGDGHLGHKPVDYGIKGRLSEWAWSPFGKMA